MECNLLVPAQHGILEVVTDLVQFFVFRGGILLLVIVLGCAHFWKVHVLFIHHLLLGVAEVRHFRTFVFGRF